MLIFLTDFYLTDFNNSPRCFTRRLIHQQQWDCCSHTSPATGLGKHCRKHFFTDISQSFIVCLPNTFLKTCLLEGAFTEDLIKMPDIRKINIAGNLVGFQKCPKPAKCKHVFREHSAKRWLQTYSRSWSQNHPLSPKGLQNDCTGDGGAIIMLLSFSDP